MLRTAQLQTAPQRLEVLCARIGHEHGFDPSELRVILGDLGIPEKLDVLVVASSAMPSKLTVTTILDAAVKNETFAHNSKERSVRFRCTMGLVSAQNLPQALNDIVPRFMEARIY